MPIGALLTHEGVVVAVDIALTLALFDRQMRRDVEPAERDALTTFAVGDDWSGVVWSRLDESTADAAVARPLPRLRGFVGHAEWKLYAYDRPDDLAKRLVSAGLEPQDEEAVLVAELCDLDLDAPLPVGVEVRAVGDTEAVALWVGVNELAFGERFGHVGRVLLRALENERPRDLGVIAYAGGEPVSAGRIEFNERSEFASLWGGGTLAEWRGRGIYRATVLERARLAHERGYRFLQVDALPTSRPILERLGFVQITTTRPYVPRRMSGASASDMTSK
jgi:GNAT superfamily N-acetyltransferase